MKPMPCCLKDALELPADVLVLVRQQVVEHLDDGDLGAVAASRRSANSTPMGPPPTMTTLSGTLAQLQRLAAGDDGAAVDLRRRAAGA